MKTSKALLCYSVGAFAILGFTAFDALFPMSLLIGVGLGLIFGVICCVIVFYQSKILNDGNNSFGSNRNLQFVSLGTLGGIIITGILRFFGGRSLTEAIIGFLSMSLGVVFFWLAFQRER